VDAGEGTAGPGSPGAGEHVDGLAGGGDRPGLSDRAELVALARELPVLATLARVARRAVRRSARLPALPDAQVEVLRVVEASPGIGTGRVAEQLQLVPNTVSTLVGELVTAGLLTRERDEADRRAARLQLTPTAEERLQQWGAVRDQVVSAALAQLAPAERQALADALPSVRHLLAVLDAVDPDDPGPVG
jgi:DNA-binding MarR family transcriptional regulator